MGKIIKKERFGIVANVMFVNAKVAKLNVVKFA